MHQLDLEIRIQVPTISQYSLETFPTSSFFVSLKCLHSTAAHTVCISATIANKVVVASYFFRSSWLIGLQCAESSPTLDLGQLHHIIAAQRTVASKDLSGKAVQEFAAMSG